MAGITSEFLRNKLDFEDAVFGYFCGSTLYVDAPSGGVVRFYGVNDGTENPLVETFPYPEKASNWGSKKVRIKSIHFELEEV